MAHDYCILGLTPGGSCMMKDLEIILYTEKREAQENTATYAIGPLTAGYGMTLGNVVRRVLLSSLPGAAVTAIRIADMRRTRQKIDHVAEEIAELILNVKHLRVRSFSDRRVSMSLDAHGKRVITAADL